MTVRFHRRSEYMLRAVKNRPSIETAARGLTSSYAAVGWKRDLVLWCDIERCMLLDFVNENDHGLSFTSAALRSGYTGYNVLVNL